MLEESIPRFRENRLNNKDKEVSMKNYFELGKNLRLEIKELVLSFMQNSPNCDPLDEGMKQAEIFRACGLDWGSYKNATSSNQQYWIVGLLRDLETDGFIQKNIETKKWHLK